MAYPTKVTVVKSGPYFSSGSISFSQLRTNFAERGSGEMKASDLRRNTNLTEENPIVPDSTENEQISTGSNLSLSQFRNSIKRYVAYQTGTDDNSSFPGEPGFRMGRLDLSNRGIDWCGDGYFGRDGQGGGTTGNLTKNVQKGIMITGTCGSVRQADAAAQMAPIVRVHNIRIDVSGSILGYGGRGGGRGGPDPDGESGGIALNLGNIGYNNRVIVGSGCRIWGGGGGGERGKTGSTGLEGLCRENTQTRGCAGGAPGCPSGFYQTGYNNNCGGCCEYFWFRNYYGCKKDWACRYCARDYTVPGGLGGSGGRGGNGRGYNNQSGSLDGENGSPGLVGGSCGGNQTIRTAENGKPGERGGNGGEWGVSGQSVPDSGAGFVSRGGSGGVAGRAVTYASDIGTRYDYYGSINSNTLKGEYT